MRFDPGLCIGEKITFAELRTIFQCGNAGGMLATKNIKHWLLFLIIQKCILTDGKEASYIM